MQFYPFDEKRDDHPENTLLDEIPHPGGTRLSREMAFENDAGLNVSIEARGCQ